MLNSGTAQISDVIGNESENSAFVYGVYGLFDKFLCGFLLYWIVSEYSSNIFALKFIMSTIGPVCSLTAFFLTFLGQKFFSHKLAKITGVEATDLKNPIK
jgi:hypothetical protein